MERVEAASRVDHLLNESDRSCVIVGVAMLDSVLTDYLRAVMKKNGLSNRYAVKVFDGNGGLGTFSAKAQVARGFALISEDIFHDLMALRKLRNEFAHAKNPCSFSDVKVTSQIDSMRFAQWQKATWSREFANNGVMELLKDKDILVYKYLFCAAVSDINIAMLESRLKHFKIDFSDLASVRPSHYISTPFSSELQ